MSDPALLLTTAHVSTTNGTKVPEIQANSGSFTALMYGALTAFVASENLLVVAAVFVKKFRGIPDVLIFTLAMSSVFNCITGLGIAVYIRAVHNEGFIGLYNLCAAQYWFSTTLRLSDVFTVTIMSVDRWLAIVKPLYYRSEIKRKHGWNAVIIALCFSGLLASFPFFGFGEISKAVIPSLCTVDWTSKLAIPIIVLAYLQFCIVLLCYGGIFRGVRQFVNRQKAMEASQQITYESPRLNRKTNYRTSQLQIANIKTVDLNSQENGMKRDESLSLRIRAAKNRTVINSDSTDSRRTSVSTQSTTPDDDLELNDNSLEVFKESHFESPEKRFSYCQTSRSIEMSSFPATHEPTSPALITVSPTLNQQLTRQSSNDSYARRGSDSSVDYNVGKFRRLRSSLGDIKPSLGKHIGSIRRKWREHTVLKRSESYSEKRQWKESQHFAKVMGVVVFVFYLTWLPLSVSYMQGFVSKRKYL